MTAGGFGSTHGTVPAYRVTVARVRQARQCSARRTNGEPCRAFAIVGGTVCRTHGGAAPQVRHAAYVAEFERRERRHFDVIYERWRQEYAEWQTGRIFVVAKLTGIPPERVTAFDVGWCRGLYGAPAGEETAPTMRRDRRFRSVQPPR